MKRLAIISSLLLGCLALTATPDVLRAQPAVSPRRSTTLHAILDSTRSRYSLPALAAAVIVDGEVIALDAVGVRKAGDPTPVTIDDRWYLGSCGKGMTATMIARLVEAGKLQWTTTIGEAFPELGKKMRKEYRGVTLEMLLTHRGGLPAATFPTSGIFEQVYNDPGDERTQRMAYVRTMLTVKPDASPGTKFIYSDAGYVIAGAMAERITGKPFDTLMAETIFKPLGITHYGFRPPSMTGEVTQPWGHSSFMERALSSQIDLFPDLRIAPERTVTSAAVDRGERRAWELTPSTLSLGAPPAISPAGQVFMSVGDWATFINAHLDGEARGGILLPETFRHLHTPPAGGSYAAGWSVVPRRWAGGNTLTHAGSNDLNYAVVWAAPEKRFALLICTNSFMGDTPAICDEVAGAILQAYLLTN